MAKKRSLDGAKKHQGRTAKPIRVTALRVMQGKFTMYLFSLNALTIYDAFSINRRQPNNDEGYQRILAPARIESVKRYLAQKKPIPGAIVASIDKATFNEAKSTLTIPAGTDVGWIIDGQHRLVGAAFAARDKVVVDFELAVVAFVGLAPKDQIEQFITINREAKNVPTSLYLDLLRHLPTVSPQDKAKERVADLAHQLRNDSESPFYERIATVTSPKNGQISLTNFTRKIFPLVSKNGLLSQFTEREQLGIISNYFQALRNVFSTDFDAKESIFFKTLGFGAWWNVFGTVFTLALKHQKGFTVKDAVAILKRVETVDFSTWGQYGQGDQAERTAGEDLRTSIALAFARDSDEAVSTIKI